MLTETCGTVEDDMASDLLCVFSQSTVVSTDDKFLAGKPQPFSNIL